MKVRESCRVLLRVILRVVSVGANDQVIEMIALQLPRHSSWKETDSVAEGFVKQMNDCAFPRQKISCSGAKMPLTHPTFSHRSKSKLCLCSLRLGCVI